MTIERRGRKWKWPAYDDQLIKVFDQVDDIDVILSHVPADRRGISIQAGGACGVWPDRLAREFEKVYTFEPDHRNFYCLLANIDSEAFSRVVAHRAALSDIACWAQVDWDKSELTNCGAGFINRSMQEIDGGCVTVMIDSLCLDRCDLVQLDVEGHEWEALLGGLETIEKFKPVVVIEEKDLPHRPMSENKARELLESLGYSEVGRAHRDVIFKC